MPDPAILRALFDRPPADAIAFLKSKGLGLTWNFQEMQDDAHARTFTVAKAGKLDILADIRGALVDNLNAGGTLEDFNRNLVPTLRAKGWWGKQVAVDPDTLDAELVQLGSVRRLKTIYQTNVQSAYMAGRYKRQMEADAFPYLQYVAVMDSKTRPSHSLLHGKIWRKDDPVWDTIYPPRGYNCRCRTRALTAGQVEREGLAVSEPAETVSREVEFGVNKVTGEAFRATQTGVKVKDALGKPVVSWTDKGFSGNPGKAWLKPFTPPPLGGLPKTFPVGAALPDLPEPTPVPATRLLPDNLTPEAYADAFLAEFGASIDRATVFHDVTGDVLPVSRDLFTDSAGKFKSTKGERGPYMRLLAESIREPDEIWLRWEESRDRPGVWLLKRRYIKSFSLNEGADVHYGLSVFEYGQDGWTGSTTMMAQPDRSVGARKRYIEKQRDPDGYVLYRKRT